MRYVCCQGVGDGVLRCGAGVLRCHRVKGWASCRLVSDRMICWFASYGVGIWRARDRVGSR